MDYYFIMTLKSGEVLAINKVKSGPYPSFEEACIEAEKLLPQPETVIVFRADTPVLYSGQAIEEWYRYINGTWCRVYLQA